MYLFPLSCYRYKKGPEQITTVPQLTSTVINKLLNRQMPTKNLKVFVLYHRETSDVKDITYASLLKI